MDLVLRAATAQRISPEELTPVKRMIGKAKGKQT
jgi:hypothetical protein